MREKIKQNVHYGSLIKSLYFLEYIDSLPLCQNVQKALNRGESYHKLRLAVSFANFGNFVSRLSKISRFGMNVVGC
nr:transposase [Viridibacillus soli]